MTGLAAVVTASSCLPAAVQTSPRSAEVCGRKGGERQRKRERGERKGNGRGGWGRKKSCHNDDTLQKKKSKSKLFVLLKK